MPNRTVYSSLTVLFEDPFWVGVYERTSAEGYEVCKITFGAEPSAEQVYRFLLANRRRLSFSPCCPAGTRPQPPKNPKRAQRQIRRQTEASGLGTKAQQAIQQQREQQKTANRADSKAHKEQEQARRYALRRQKAKEKHRGH